MFLILWLCFCFEYVCEAASAEEGTFVDGVECFALQDEESLLYGFSHTRIRGATAKTLLLDIKAARNDVMCTKVYQGYDVDSFWGRISQTVHFSIQHESRLSVNVARAFLEEYDLQAGFFCGALEDIADFGPFLSASLNTKTQVCIGLPPKAHPCQKFCRSAYGYDAFLTRYKARNMGNPIVFFSSGNRGFAGAGEFLFQCQQALGEVSARVHVFFTALERGYCDVHEGLARAANARACSEGFDYNLQYWRRFVHACVGRVVCQRARQGHVVFAQDPGNVLVAPWPLDSAEHLAEQEGPWDVFVGWPSSVKNHNMAPYLAQAHMLFETLSKTLGVGCITGQENIEDMPSRAQHTLVCVDGPSFGFARQFGAWMQDRFNYKNVQFLTNDLTTVCAASGRSLLAEGFVGEADEDKSPYFDVLWMHERVFKDRPLKGREAGIVLEGCVYARMWDGQSRANGFEYALQRQGTARSILSAVRREQEDFSCAKVYRCLYEKSRLAQLGAVKHLSLGYEKKLSERAVGLLLRTYKIHDCFLCVSFEDLVVFGAVGALLQEGVVHVSDPEKRYPLRARSRFDACLRQYTPGRPIVFCASGRDGCVSAGEFLYALSCNEDIKEQKPRLYFLVTTLAQEALFGRDGCGLILQEAIKYSCRAHESLFYGCTQCVAVADLYDGQLVFAQESTNLLVGLKPDYSMMRHRRYHRHPYDVLVNWLPTHDKDAMSVAYRNSAQCLFEGMRNYGDVGCVTGDETGPSKRERTLLCVKSERFDGAEIFGRSIAEKLGYKAVDFISCDSECIYHSVRMVANGVVETPVMPEALVEIWHKGYSHPSCGVCLV